MSLSFSNFIEDLGQRPARRFIELQNGSVAIRLDSFKIPLPLGEGRVRVLGYGQKTNFCFAVSRYALTPTLSQREREQEVLDQPVAHRLHDGFRFGMDLQLVEDVTDVE